MLADDTVVTWELTLSVDLDLCAAKTCLSSSGKEMDCTEKACLTPGFVQDSLVIPLCNGEFPGTMHGVDAWGRCMGTMHGACLSGVREGERLAPVLGSKKSTQFNTCE